MPAMKAVGKAILAWAIVGLMGVTGATAAAADEGPRCTPPAVEAGAAVLMDADTGQVLYGKEERRRMQPASLTKIMTTLLALRRGDLTEAVTMPAQAMDRMWESTTVGLRVGERTTMEELLYAMMLPSANDAANAVAIHLAGSLEEFVGWMNGAASDLGLEDTHFQNAHGLPDRRHYTTAYDMAQITRAALEDPRFAQIAGAASHTIPATNKSRARGLSHLSKMVVPGAASYYPGAIAAKTGWTSSAGNCLMTAARREDRTLIVIILDSDYAVVDTAKLLDYGFGQFQRSSVRVPDINDKTVTLADTQGSTHKAVVPAAGEEVSFLLPSGAREDAVRVRMPDPEALSRGERLTLDLVLEDGGEDSWPYSLTSLDLVLEDPPPDQTAGIMGAGAGSGAALPGGSWGLAAPAVGGLLLAGRRGRRRARGHRT